MKYTFFLLDIDLQNNLDIDDEPPDILLSKLKLSWFSCSNWAVNNITFGMYKNNIDTNCDRVIHKYYPVIYDKKLLLNKWDFIEKLKAFKNLDLITFENIPNNVLNFNNFLFIGGLMATTSLLGIIKQYILKNNDTGLLFILSQLDDNFYQEGSLAEIKNRIMSTPYFKFKTFTYISPSLSMFLIDNNFIKIVEEASYLNNVCFMIPNFLLYVLTNPEMVTAQLTPQFTENVYNGCKVTFIPNSEILEKRIILSEALSKMIVNSKVFGQ